MSASLATKEAAKFLGISVFYLRNMRHLLHTHEGPECIAQPHPRGICYVYPIAGLIAWRESHNWRKKSQQVEYIKNIEDAAEEVAKWSKSKLENAKRLYANSD